MKCGPSILSAWPLRIELPPRMFFPDRKRYQKMKLDVLHKLYGHTITEHIQTVSAELPVDAVGLWQIVPVGRDGFGLSDDDLVEFVRRCILALLKSDAKPVVGGGGTEYDWILQRQYGETSEEIADAVVEEWVASGAGDPDVGGLWFALLSPYVDQGNRFQ